MINFQKKEQANFQQLLTMIESSDDSEIMQIMNAVMRRYKTRFPDWEVLYISCPKYAPVERQRTMEFIINHFRQHT